jgi:pimeloyl-ACP methyl ester carboxylesterase
MSNQSKPSIVFAHGLWADGSCFSKLIPTLQAEGHEVMASQHGLDSLATDVAAVKACLARVRSPAILVGHSYGGTLITHAGTDPRVAGSSISRLSRQMPTRPRRAGKTNSRALTCFSTSR